MPQKVDKESDSRNAPERFPLLRYFVSTTLLVTIAIAIALAVLLVRRADNDFEDLRKARGSAEAGHIAELFYHDILGPAQQQGATVLLADVIDASKMDAFTSRTTLGLGILSLTFMNVDGTILWSSDSRSNGMYQLDEELHTTVVDQGTSATALRRRVASTSAEDRYVDLVRTLFPLRDVRPNAPEEGQLVGILAVDQDVTEDLAKARSESLRFALLASTGTGAVLFALLFLIVYRADRTLGTAYERILRHDAERERDEEMLRDSNRKLEEALSELEETQQRAIQQERLRALGQMASGIAHDFNNALTPILGFSELPLTNPEQLEDKALIERYMRMINTAAKDAAAVVSRMREFYRKRDGGVALAPVNLNNLIAQAISLTQVKWKDEAQARGVAIQVETDLQEIPLVAGNESELRELLTNLIFNAVDAIPLNGTITIRTRRSTKHAVLEVSDTGSGMTEDVLQRCMDPFFTTKESEGTGMGLAMVYGIVQRHDGKLEIESQVGKGTRFIITLPFATAAEENEDGPGTNGRTAYRLNVLVVDDEPAVRHLVTEYLKTDGHSVETATNGEEALEKFRAGTFELVVTDRAMPKMSGDRLAEAIKQEPNRKPVIMLTGFGEIMEAANDDVPGVNAVLGKPLTLSALRQAVEEVMHEWENGEASGAPTTRS